jgi:hypothetical protein
VLGNVLGGLVWTWHMHSTCSLLNFPVWIWHIMHIVGTWHIRHIVGTWPIMHIVGTWHIMHIVGTAISYICILRIYCLVIKYRISYQCVNMQFTCHKNVVHCNHKGRGPLPMSSISDLPLERVDFFSFYI